jgi:hypothetical protein
MPTDRTENHNVAAKHPEMVARMSNQWHDMAANILVTKGKELTPVATSASPKLNPSWTQYDRSAPAKIKGKSKKKPSKAPPGESLPRARKDTKLTVEGPQLILTSTGADPGLAFEHLSIESPGPYLLKFRLQSHATGKGEVYWTHDAQTILPKGLHQVFQVTHDGEWHELSIKLDDTRLIHGLRLDPFAGPGSVRLEGLRLTDSNGKTLQQWP